MQIHCFIILFLFTDRSVIGMSGTQQLQHPTIDDGRIRIHPNLTSEIGLGSKYNRRVLRALLISIVGSISKAHGCIQ